MYLLPIQYLPNAGDWDGIRFWQESSGQFDFCTFEYGGINPSSMVDNGMIVFSSYKTVSFQNCLFQYSKAPAIKLYKPYTNMPYPNFLGFANNEFKHLDQFSLSLYPQSFSSVDYSNEFNNHDIEVYEYSVGEYDEGYILWKNLGTDYYTEEFFSINSENGLTFEFEAGVKLKFNYGGFRVGSGSLGSPGKLIASGTADEPVIFTSAKAEPSNGDWWGIQFQQKVLDGCLLDNCQVLYAGESTYDFKQAAVHVIYYGSKVTIKNSTIAYSSHGGICISMHAEPILENNTFFDNIGGNGCDEGY